MKFCLIIPTRGDRPKLIERCKFQIKRQTLQPEVTIWINDPPVPNVKDVTKRYRLGIERATKLGYDFAVFWEDDDWYHPQYLEWLINGWNSNGKPDLFGVGETYYYNINVDGKKHMKHTNRTSAFCTMVKLPFKGTWPADNYPYLDLHLAKKHKVVTQGFTDKIYAIGIKHGIGMSGGGGHRESFKWDSIGQTSKDWLKNHLSVDDLKFYDSIKGKREINEERTIQPKINKNIRSNPVSQFQPRSRKIVKIRKR